VGEASIFSSKHKHEGPPIPLVLAACVIDRSNNAVARILFAATGGAKGRANPGLHM
jgi:hypothetical protein